MAREQDGDQVMGEAGMGQLPRANVGRHTGNGKWCFASSGPNPWN